MTGNEFIDLLKTKGSFMRPEDLESLVSFYETKLLRANSVQEEEAIVNRFGDLDAVMERVKAEYQKANVVTSPPSAQTTQGASNVASSAETRAVDTEEVLVHKAKENEEGDALDSPPSSSKEASSPSPKKPSRYGIANRLLDKLKWKGEKRRKGKIVLSLLFSPVFLLPALAILLVFLGAMAGILLCAAAMLALETALILLAVVEIVYAIVSFFTNVPVALIELGLGTVLVAVVVAVTALIYQLFIGVLPVAIKKVNVLRKRSFTFFYELIYGSKGGRQ